MGLAIGIFYLPILIGLVVAAMFLGKKLYLPPSHVAISSRVNGAVIVLGAVITAVLALVAAAMVPSGKADWLTPLIVQMGITLGVPFLAGFLMIYVSRSRGDSPFLQVILNRLAVGSFHAVWVIPVSLYYYVQFAL